MWQSDFVSIWKVCGLHHHLSIIIRRVLSHGFQKRISKIWILWQECSLCTNSEFWNFNLHFFFKNKCFIALLEWLDSKNYNNQESAQSRFQKRISKIWILWQECSLCTIQNSQLWNFTLAQQSLGIHGLGISCLEMCRPCRYVASLQWVQTFSKYTDHISIIIRRVLSHGFQKRISKIWILWQECSLCTNSEFWYFNLHFFSSKINVFVNVFKHGHFWCQILLPFWVGMWAIWNDKLVKMTIIRRVLSHGSKKRISKIWNLLQECSLCKLQIIQKFTILNFHVQNNIHRCFCSWQWSSSRSYATL